MAFATMNPVRLVNTHLVSVGELLIDPEKDLRCVSLAPYTFNAINILPVLEAECYVSLVMTAVEGKVRAGLVLRVRMSDDAATPERCAAIRDALIPRAISELQEMGASPVQPLAEEGIFALLPREGMRFFRRATDETGTPLFNQEQQPIPYKAIEHLLLNNPGSGLCLSMLSAPELDHAYFTLVWWGDGYESLAAAFEIVKVPLVPCTEVEPGDTLRGFELLYDPWKLHHDITRKAGDPELTTTNLRELMSIFGDLKKSEPAPAAEAPAAKAPASIGATARQATQELMTSLPELKEQMRATLDLFRQGVQEQVTKAAGEALSSVQQQISQISSQLTSMPGMQQASFTDTLTRMNERIERVNPSQLAEEMRTAGLARPLDALTLMKMGFNSEKELLDLGLTDDLLALLRATVQLRQQCPLVCSEDTNCMPYAFMIGYMYEALINHCFVPLFHATGGYHKAHHLADYTRVNWDHCQRLAAFPGYHNSAMRAMTPQDWAGWLTICNIIRSLRNRQHSDRSTGFISHDELEAAYDAFFFPGQFAKLSLLRLPAFSATPPAWAKEFQPELPAEWAGVTPAEQRQTVQRHIVSRVTAFTPSLFQFLLRCRNISLQEETL